MTDFNKFKIAVDKQFQSMQQYTLYRTDVPGDTLWDTYLASFPEGSNPIFRERTSHDCTCCKQFIRSIGNVVAILNDEIVSIWDGLVDDPVYAEVSKKLSNLAKSKPIINLYLSVESKAGTDKSYEESGLVWEHFYTKIDSKNICKSTDLDTKLSDFRTTVAMMQRALEELSMDSVDTVLELIAQNSLYRGEEHKNTLVSFRTLKSLYDKILINGDKNKFVWSQVLVVRPQVARIRNTSIGTLLIDLSSNMDLESAVRRYESVVAPANYKRPTALVTKAMVDKARSTIEDLGLTSALERRYATMSDITINNVIFADRSVKKTIGGDVFDSIDTKTSAKKFDKVEEITIEKFISDIVPTAKSIEVMLENRHSNNLVSLIAPVDPDAANLFKWDNNFSWSYVGNVTDSIKERVKRAGGNVSGDLCFRLSWSNYDDLDLHMLEPNYEIYYGEKRSYITRGELDVDMNAGSGQTRSPVENIFYPDKSSLINGTYELVVNQFAKRESTDIGFEVEFDYLGDTRSYVYDRPLRSKEKVSVVKFEYNQQSGIRIISELPPTTSSKEFWGIKSNDFHRVNLLLLSPNYWDGKGVGNKHYFFMLDNCMNDGQARGFYNEFLVDSLTPHRKVIEIVGSKMMTDESNNQLSGLGFSSTKSDNLIVRVGGSFTRMLKIVF